MKQHPQTVSKAAAETKREDTLPLHLPNYCSTEVLNGSVHLKQSVIREVARSQRSPSLIPSVTQKSLLIIINNPIYVFINCHPPEKDWLKPCRYLISSFKLIGHSHWNTEDVHVHTSKLGNKNARWEKLSAQVTFQSERILTLSLWPQQSQQHITPSAGMVNKPILW